METDDLRESSNCTLNWNTAASFQNHPPSCFTKLIYIYCMYIYGVSGGIIHILGGGSMDYSE
jgi:hypothetical protein